MDELINEAFKGLSVKPPSSIPQMACWASYAKDAGLSIWDCFKKLGLNNKAISQFCTRRDEGFSNYQRKQWLEYDKLHNLEIRFIISKMI